MILHCSLVDLINVYLLLSTFLFFSICEKGVIQKQEQIVPDLEVLVEYMRERCLKT